MTNIKYTVFTIDAEIEDHLIFHHYSITRRGNNKIFTDALMEADEIITRCSDRWPGACRNGEDMEIYIKDYNRFMKLAKNNNVEPIEEELYGPEF